MTLVWVIYDIVENKVRTKIVNICKGVGLYRVQKSVFLGDLGSNARDSIILEFESIIDPLLDLLLSSLAGHHFPFFFFLPLSKTSFS